MSVMLHTIFKFLILVVLALFACAGYSTIAGADSENNVLDDSASAELARQCDSVILPALPIVEDNEKTNKVIAEVVADLLDVSIPYEKTYSYWTGHISDINSSGAVIEIFIQKTLNFKKGENNGWSEGTSVSEKHNYTCLFTGVAKGKYDVEPTAYFDYSSTRRGFMFVKTHTCPTSSNIDALLDIDRFDRECESGEWASVSEYYTNSTSDYWYYSIKNENFRFENKDISVFDYKPSHPLEN